jgi:adenosylcobinamide kinase/adenosylcobinamide-phosphate guanylyltransferase
VGELVLVLGGTRSGKSRVARDRARRIAGDGVTFIATARAGDPELDARIAAHRRDRPPAWRTLDATDDLAVTLATVDDAHVALLDSLTLWASLAVEAGRDLDASWRAAVPVIARRPRATIVVSDEVGWGIVPTSPLARRFRDELGFLHQKIAADANAVVLCVAGIPIAIKGTI